MSSHDFAFSPVEGRSITDVMAELITRTEQRLFGCALSNNE